MYLQSSQGDSRKSIVMYCFRPAPVTSFYWGVAHYNSHRLKLQTHFEQTLQNGSFEFVSISVLQSSGKDGHFPSCTHLTVCCSRGLARREDDMQFCRFSVASEPKSRSFCLQYWVHQTIVCINSGLAPAILPFSKKL